MLVDFDVIASSLKTHHNHSLLVLEETIQATRRELEHSNQQASARQVDRLGFTQKGVEIKNALMTAYDLYEKHQQDLSIVDKISMLHWIRTIDHNKPACNV